jgi:multicomponent Na+:H+ antiporter subunit G
MSAATFYDVVDFVGALLLFAGALLSVVAAVGILRFPDLLTRMHSATKPQVLGLVLVALGLALVLRDTASSLVLVLVVLAQLVTAPVAGHMVGRASYRAGQMDKDLLLVDEISDSMELRGDDRGAP